MAEVKQHRGSVVVTFDVPISTAFSLYRMHIAIVGNIGAGKTTLAHKLAQHFRWEVFLEEVDDNPYLKDFYADMPRWAFHLQVYFLNGRFRQTRRIKELVQEGKSVIQDRTIYEDAHIFAANLHQSGLLAPRDYDKPCQSTRLAALPARRPAQAYRPD
jgi:deoxyadenosine/deoxycytidine kinase